MVRIIDICSTGKTKRLMELAEKNKTLIVCANPSAMKYKASVYGFRGIDFIDYRTFIYNYKELGNFYVDELENLVTYWLENFVNLGCGGINKTPQDLEEELAILLDEHYCYFIGYTLTTE